MSFLDYAHFTIGICDSLQNCKLGLASVYKIKTEAKSMFNFLRHSLELHLSPVNKKKTNHPKSSNSDLYEGNIIFSFIKRILVVKLMLSL